MDSLSEFPDALGRCDNDVFTKWIGMALGCIALATCGMGVAGFGVLRSGQRWHLWVFGTLLAVAASIAAFAGLMLIVSPFASDSCVTYV